MEEKERKKRKGEGFEELSWSMTTFIRNQNCSPPSYQGRGTIAIRNKLTMAEFARYPFDA